MCIRDRSEVEKRIHQRAAPSAKSVPPVNKARKLDSKRNEKPLKSTNRQKPTSDSELSVDVSGKRLEARASEAAQYELKHS